MLPSSRSSEAVGEKEKNSIEGGGGKGGKKNLEYGRKEEEGPRGLDQKRNVGIRSVCEGSQRGCLPGKPKTPARAREKKKGVEERGLHLETGIHKVAATRTLRNCSSDGL